jgi:hypothetical protein
MEHRLGRKVLKSPEILPCKHSQQAIAELSTRAVQQTYYTVQWRVEQHNRRHTVVL